VCDIRDNRRAITVQRADSGVTLIGLLDRRFTYQSLDQWEGHIASGRITVNGEPYPADRALQEGDEVRFVPEARPEPDVRFDYRVIMSDDDFLFVDKPPDLPCHPGGIYLHHTLWALLERDWGTVHLVNRLDRETSGLVIVARNPAAAAFAAREMAERRVEKSYLVLVRGDFPERLDAVGRLEPHPDSPVRKQLRFVPAEDAGATREQAPARGIGRERAPGRARDRNPASEVCRTEFWLLRRCADGLSLVGARLHTGKTHQIRATLRSLGFPVVGDKIYGEDPAIFTRFIAGELTDADRRLLRMEHQALHCAELRLAKPTGGWYEVETPPPTTWIER